MCCLHNEAFDFFLAPDRFVFLFFWPNMALSAFWVTDPLSRRREERREKGIGDMDGDEGI